MRELDWQLETAEGKFCFYGLGPLSKENFSQLQLLLGKNPTFLFDQDKSKWGKSFHGVKCLNLRDFLALPRSTVIFITVRDIRSASEYLGRNGFENIYCVAFERAEWRVKNVTNIKSAQDKRVLADTRLRDISKTTCYISGATGGVGSTIAHHMAQHGARLLIHGKSRKKLLELERSLIHVGAQVESVACDFLNSNQLKLHCEWLQQFTPSIDFYYLNAGISLQANLGGLTEGSIEGWERTYRVNVLAPAALLKVIHARSAKDISTAKCFLTTSAINKNIDSQAYACSKAALDKIVFDASLEFSKQKELELCSIDPGWLRTNMGGTNAPADVYSVLPGAVFAAHTNHSVAGSMITAQDYSGLTVEQAIRQAMRNGDLEFH